MNGEKVLNLSPDWKGPDNFEYFGDGLPAGQCGVRIKSVRTANHGTVRCFLGVAADELEGAVPLTVASKCFFLCVNILY